MSIRIAQPLTIPDTTLSGIRIDTNFSRDLEKLIALAREIGRTKIVRWTDEKGYYQYLAWGTSGSLVVCSAVLFTEEEAEAELVKLRAEAMNARTLQQACKKSAEIVTLIVAG